MPKKNNQSLIVAIDGPAGSGKSTVAKLVAEALDAPYIDTGAMYRAVTLKAMIQKISFQDTKKLIQIAKKSRVDLVESKSGNQKVLLDGRDVSKKIRHPELTKNVFYVAKEPLIRREMVKKQRFLGKKAGAVMEGRDIGTVVFPKADFKFFLDANVKVRAKRRYKELLLGGKKVDFKDVLRDLRKRDASDKNRKEGPLRVARGAHVIHTTSLTIPQVVDRILDYIHPNRCCIRGLGEKK